MIETHHSAKKDAPSGTALAIIEAMEGSSERASRNEHSHRLGSGNSRADFRRRRYEQITCGMKRAIASLRRWRAKCGTVADRKEGSVHNA